MLLCQREREEKEKNHYEIIYVILVCLMSDRGAFLVLKFFSFERVEGRERERERKKREKGKREKEGEIRKWY